MYKDLFKLDGKTAIITGGAGLLGQEFSSALADFGANVVVVDINKEHVEKFVKKLQKKSKSKIIGLVCDVSDKTSVDSMVSNVIAKFGCIDILHNNVAGKSDDLSLFFESYEKYNLSQWNKINNKTGNEKYCYHNP